MKKNTLSSWLWAKLTIVSLFCEIGNFLWKNKQIKSPQKVAMPRKKGSGTFCCFRLFWSLFFLQCIFARTYATTYLSPKLFFCKTICCFAIIGWLETSVKSSTLFCSALFARWNLNKLYVSNLSKLPNQKGILEQIVLLSLVFTNEKKQLN